MRKVFYRVARVGDVPPGEGRLVTVGEDEDCALFCTEEGDLYAAGSLCPHQNEPFDRARLEGCEVICRRHHLRFDLRSGDCTNASGFWMRTLEVKREGDEILIGVWED